MKNQLEQVISTFDDRRDLALPGNLEQTLTFCVEHFIEIGKSAIAKQGIFSVALSGGSTPKAIFQLLATDTYRSLLDWSRVQLFWSDERCVPPSDPDSNYKMAMDAGFSKLPLDPQKIFRMPADSADLDQAAHDYEQTIKKHVPNAQFDLVMLGMGEDGHTASLFPKTHGLSVEGKLVTANFIPQKDCWRMTLTYEEINSSHHIAIYTLGKSKAEMVEKVLHSSYEPELFPIQRVGTRQNKVLWILDSDAAANLKKK